MASTYDGPDSQRGIPWLGIVAVVALLVVLTGIVVYSGIVGPKGEVAVPKLVGASLPDARDVLSGADLDVDRIERRQTMSTAENVVLSQTPSAGSIVPRGSKVSLIVSTDLGKGKVPDVGAMEFQDAVTAIEAAGYEVEVKEVVKTKSVAGTVVRQSPAAGRSSKSGKVSVYIAVGVEEDIRTPAVVGLAQPAAVSILEDAGLRTLSYWVAATRERVVLEQYPPSGMLVAPGTVVRLGIAGGLDNPTLPLEGIAGAPATGP